MNWEERQGSLKEDEMDAEFMSYWRRRFSVTLQKCNSKVVLRKVSPNRLMEDDVVSRDRYIQCFIHLNS